MEGGEPLVETVECDARRRELRRRELGAAAAHQRPLEVERAPCEIIDLVGERSPGASRARPVDDDAAGFAERIEALLGGPSGRGDVAHQPGGRVRGEPMRLRRAADRLLERERSGRDLEGDGGRKLASLDVCLESVREAVEQLQPVT